MALTGQDRFAQVTVSAAADAPTTYGSDTVWSYETGAKLRLFENRLQVNGSAYRIDWQNVQLNVSIPGCGPTFIQNAGTARSQGFDMQAAGRLFAGLTANVNVGYDNAHYTQTAFGPQPKNGTAATPVVPEPMKGSRTRPAGHHLSSIIIRPTGFSFG